MNQKLTLRIYDRSISVGEHRSLREAAALAATSQAVTYLEFAGGEAAVVPVEAAQMWEAFLAGWCRFCVAGRHEDCPQHFRGGQHCGCDERRIHQDIFSSQVALARSTRRR